MIVRHSVSQICSDINLKPHIMQAFRVSNKIFLVVNSVQNNLKLYKLEEMEYRNEQITYKSIVEVNKVTDWFQMAKLFFTIRHPAYNNELKVIGISYEKVILLKQILNNRSQ